MPGRIPTYLQATGGISQKGWNPQRATLAEVCAKLCIRMEQQRQFAEKPMGKLCLAENV